MNRGIALAAGVMVAASASAGGPLAVRTNGLPFAWNTTSPIQYRTDDGPLSASVSKAQALTRVQNMFKVWQDVPSAAISYNRAGDIRAVGAYTGGDVNTAAEFNAVEGDCGDGNQSPVIFDADATIFKALGVDETSVIGFAGPCGLDIAQGLIVTGHAVMNGLFQDGQMSPVPDLTPAEFDATFVHEFGHFSGLDHSQINYSCALLICGAEDTRGLPTMFPFLVSDEQRTLSVDDVAWISKLYPANGPSGFAATHGTITGVVYFSDAESHAQLVNVIARPVDNPATPGVNESRTNAASNISGYRFRVFNGNPINQADSQPLGPFGSQDPALIGFFEIPVPPGRYTLQVESVYEQFVDGSSVGGPTRIPMPGAAPTFPIGPFDVTAGASTGGHDIVLIGTNSRFDGFEGP